MNQSPNDILKKGLRHLKIPYTDKTSKKWKLEQFAAHYGSSPETLADQWYDLCTFVVSDEEARIEEGEKSEMGLRRFLISHFFLWNYPRNEKVFATHFSMSSWYARGEPLWRWVRLIGALKEKKIVWHPRLNDADTERFFATVDCTNYSTTEKKHPTLNKDPKMYDVKSNGAGLKYEIAMAVFHPQVISIQGPFPASVHDMTLWRQKLKGMIPEGKMIIADRGYETFKPGESEKLSVPNKHDSKDVENFKTRARLRLETFNGRLKFFKSLSEKFRHPIDKHKLVFEAVVVTVQYQMDNGSPIFAV